jgi:hypothetical protein
MLIELPVKLEKNYTAFYFNVFTLCLCCCQSYSVRSLNVFIVIFYPSNLINTNITLLQGILILFY